MMKNINAFLLWIGIFLLTRECLATESDDLMKETCNLFQKLHEKDFTSNIVGNDQLVKAPRHDPRLNCQARKHMYDIVLYENKHPFCIKYRMEYMLYELMNNNAFNTNASYTVRKHLLCLGLAVSNDYDELYMNCNISSKRLPVKSPTLYNHVVKLLRLNKGSQTCSISPKGKCSLFLKVIKPSMVSLPAETWLMVTLSEHCSEKTSSRLCKYLSLNKFALTIDNFKDAFRKRKFICDTLTFAFIYSSFLFNGTSLKGIIAINETKVENILRHTINLLLKKANTSGCQSRVFWDYSHALIFMPITEWYQRKLQIQKSKTNGLFDMFCDVMDTVVFISEYFNQLESKTKLIDIRLNHTSVLEADSLVSEDKGLECLRKNFIKIREWNMKKANNDLDYIKTSLESYANNLHDVSEKIGAYIGFIFATASNTSVKNASKEGAKLIRLYAEECNPFNFILKKNLTRDSEQATLEFMATVTPFNGSGQLMEALFELNSTVVRLNKDIVSDQGILNLAYQIVSRDTGLEGADLEEAKANFMKLYETYNPTVKEPRILAIGSLYDTVVSDTCDLLNNGQDVYETVNNVSGIDFAWLNSIPQDPCLTARWSITQMVNLLLEIHDFQFELIEMCAVSIRTKLAEAKADALTSGTLGSLSAKLTEEDRTNLAKIYDLVTHCLLIQEHCDILEYQNAGTSPIECNNDQVNVTILMATKNRDRSSKQFTINIPDVREGTDPFFTIDIERLLSGEIVTFHIPDFDWLIKHGGFSESERGKEFLVKDVIAFVPFLTEGKTRVTSRVSASGGIQFYEHSPVYVLINPFVSQFTYSEGTSSLDCKNELKPNMYTLCQKDPLEEYCPIMNYTHTDSDCMSVKIPPSIYVDWSIQIYGYEKQKMPVAKTKRSVKLQFSVWELERYDKVMEKIGSKRDKTDEDKKCCRSTEYWDEDASECRQCPAGSIQMLKGYYCAEKTSDKTEGPDEMQKGYYYYTAK